MCARSLLGAHSLIHVGVCITVHYTFSDLTFEIANLFAKPQGSHPVGYLFYLFQLLKFCALHQEYCSALTFGKNAYSKAVYTAMAVRITVFDHTLVGNHVHSREEVLG